MVAEGHRGTPAGLPYNQLVSETDTETKLQELRELVLAAFDQARLRGKPDWTRMRTAVLKNRLLQMTGGRFDQSRYGDGSMSAVLSQLPDLLTITTAYPPIVELVDPAALTDVPPQVVAQLPPPQASKAASPTEAEPPAQWRDVRIRDDLWNAIVHWEDGQRYTWDVEQQVARAKQLSDSDDFDLPTLGREEVAKLRAAFVYARAASEPPAMREVFEGWIAGSGGASDLPRPYRGAWLEHLKSHVHGLILRWFSERSLALPKGLLLRAEARGSADPAVVDVVRTRLLRSFLVGALEVMTYEQMASVQLPAEVLFKLHDRN